MFRTKKDVDRHSQEVLNKVKTEKERNLRCLSIAQQYYNIRDYDSAKKYVSMYLSVKDDSSVAHKLLGQCFEQFGEKTKALQEYLNSLQLDAKQPELILKVCELFVDDDCVIDKSQARQWFETGEKQFPYHPTILKLRKKIFLTDDNNYSSLEATLTGEVKSKPCDPVLHTQLLTFYIDNGRVREAYDEAFGKSLLFTPSIQWYQCAVKICKSYKVQFPSALKEEFYANNLLSLERLLALAVQDVKISRKSIPECVSFLARFDETLSDAILLVNKSVKFQQIINHMCGQLCFHTANILYRKLKWEDNNSQEMNQLISPLLLLSTSKEFKIPEDRSLGDTLLRVYNSCLVHNAYRILQSGFVLHGLAKESPKQFIEKIFHLCVANYWKERISEKVYSTSDYKTFRKSSFFVTYSAFSNLPAELPTLLAENVEKNISIVENINPMSLHHLVWLGVNYLGLLDNKSLCDMYLSHQFFTKKFNVLPFYNQSMESNYAESLCRLDADAFLYASVFCAKSYVDQHIVTDKYQIVPADVSKPMCSPEQEQWWECVYQICLKTTPENNIPRSRLTLQRGIEAVRLSGVGSMPLPLLVLLGRTFARRAAVESDGDKASALEERAALYWKTALPLLEKVARNEVTVGPTKSMFEYHKNIITKAEAIKLIDEGKRIVGMLLIKENDYSESICDQVNESFGDFNTTMSSTSVTNVLGDKIVQNLMEQNTKIIDKLETLFNKQELLCSNQFQLLEMISTLTKKFEDLGVSDYAAKSQPAQSSFSQNAFGGSLSGSISLATQPIAPKVQTNFPMYPFVHPQINTNLNSSFQAPPLFQKAFDVGGTSVPGLYPGLPTSVAWNLSNYSLNRDQSVTDEFPADVSKLESEYELAKAAASYAPVHSVPQPSLNTSFVSTSQSVIGNTSFTEPSRFISQSQKLASSASTYPIGVSPTTTSALFSNVSLKSSTPAPAVTPSDANTFATPKTPSYAFAAAKTTTPPINVPHSYQIPVPESSSIIKSPPIEVPEEDDDDTQPIDYDPIPNFKPIIPLPDEVDVKTGEENEEVLYENRVKLFRFVDKEWKERGIGVYKLLKNPETGKVRALMRREMVHKVCANHLLSEDIVLTPMKTSDRAWLYCAPDYADERLQVEQFCIKFKTVEEAAKFYEAFNKYKAGTPKSSAKNNATPVKPSNDSKPVAVIADETNKKNVATVPATKEDQSAIPKSTAFSFGGSAAIKAEPIKPISTAFSFGAKPAESTKIETKPATVDGKSIIAPPLMKIVNKTDTKPEVPKSNTFSFGSAAVIADPIKPTSNTFSFGGKSAETTNTETKSAFAGFTGFSLNTLQQPSSMSSLFQTKTVATIGDAMPKNLNEHAPFSAVTNTVDFSNLSVPSTGFAKNKDFKGFDGAGSLVFGSLGASPKSNTVASPVAAILKNVELKDQTSEKADTSHDITLNESTTAADEEFVPNQEFKPVIPLPDLVEVKTGEEDLVTLYDDRCKLFRYTGEEWKERGVGIMKILQDPKDGSVRLLMRREQVYKLCCNQRITKEHELKPHSTSDKAWTWCGQDFSEGELKTETFCVRFKTTEQALAFRDAFNNAKSRIETPKKTTARSTATAEETLPKLSDMFKKETGSWECKMCYVVNKKDTDTCVSCMSPKNPSEQKPSAGGGGSVFGSSSTDGNKFSFGSLGASSKPEPSAFTFGMPAASSVNTAGTTSISVAPKDNASNVPTSDPSFKFTFGSIDSSAAVSSSSSAASTTFSFGSGAANANLFNFGVGQTTNATTLIKENKFSFTPVTTPGSNATESFPTFTPIASQNSVGQGALSFGNTTPVSSTVGLFDQKQSDLGNKPDTTRNEPADSALSRFSFGSSKAQENTSVFGSAKSGSTPISFAFGKPEQNASIFGSGSRVSANTSLFGTPISSRSESTSEAFNSFTFKSDTPSPSSDKSGIKNSQESTPFYERFPVSIHDKDEITYFKSLVKLYSRIGAKEEEIGSGNLYILKNPESNKTRLLMTREPAELVCLNHFVTVDTIFDKFDDYSWTWRAPDFSTGEIVEKIFRVVFNEIETAEKFRKSIDDVMKDAPGNSSDSTGSSEVEFISETQITEDEKKLAVSLQLPPNYFAYKYIKDCPGCVGCDEEDKKLKKENKENLLAGSTQPQTSLFAGAMTKSNPVLSSDTNKPNFVFGGITNDGGTWLNNGTFKLGSLFNKPISEPLSSPSQKTVTTEGGGSDGEDDGVVKNDQDPHFEPIIPLPDIVETRTGEESEEIKFCERGKLFRYSEDAKEWKERGIGEMKVLYHPVDKTYRLLMRREQIHKVVLNQRITTTLNLQPLSANKNSWCWFGMNLPEEQSEPVLEKLAIRFKTEAISKQFFLVVQDALFDLHSPQTRLNESCEEVNQTNESDDRRTASDVDDDQDYEDGNYDEYDHEYEDEADEYENDYYVDEQAIGEAMEELDVEEGKETVYEKAVRMWTNEGSSSLEYDGVVKLLKKYEEDGPGCIAFFTPEETLFAVDITDKTTLIDKGNGNVEFLELYEDEFEKRMSLQFENEDDAQKFTSSFRSLVVPSMY